MHYWWSCEVIPPLWRTIWSYAQRLPNCAYLLIQQYHYYVCITEIVKKAYRIHMYKNISSSFFCGVQELETEGMPISWGMADQGLVHECNGILLCSKKWWAGRLQKNLDLQELRLSEIRRTRTLYREQPQCTTNSYDRHSSSQQRKDLRQLQETQDGKWCPRAEQELAGQNGDQSMLFVGVWLCPLLMFLLPQHD